jgi:protoheme IX farnesyltransferase
MNIYWRLIRPGLLLTVLFSMAIAALTAPEPPSWTCLIHALLGTALLIIGATVMNQLVERRSDAAMERTASRPLPKGQWTPRQATRIAVFASLAGLGYLAALEPPIVTLLAALSWGIYVLIYTPLKRVSVWHIPLGALAGAIPVLLGAATANAVFTAVSLTLFGVVFFWQFPHTAAIGWIYREQYRRGEMKVAAVADPSGRLTGRLALIGAVGLLTVSLVPAMLSMVGWLYVVVVMSLGLTHLAIAAEFLNQPSDANARTLWRVSLVHLPVLLISLLTSVTNLWILR